MKKIVFVYVLILSLIVSVNVMASGLIGIYAVIEKVVFEPNDKAPQRIKIWGAFKMVDGPYENGKPQQAQRGYLYFKISPDRSLEATKKEWADLKAVAGTGQAIAFGNIPYFGSFDHPAGGTGIRFHTGILGFSNPFDAPDPYITNAGIIRISETGSQANLVKELRQALNNLESAHQC